jgi:ubiquinone biosynthesis accessory factor UbiK
MIKPSILADLAAQLSKALPEHVGTLKNDFEKNCHAILNKTFAKFDLVTREEFDTQSKVLQRTRKKLEELEKHLAALEKASKTKHHK